MTNELTARTERTMLSSGASIAGIVPTTIEEVFRLAGAVNKAGLAPYGLETPEKLTIAIMTGLEVGLPPMQAIQSIAVINNRPTIWGDGLIAIVRQSPLCLYVKEWIDGEGDAMIAYCQTHRRGEPEPVIRSFSVDDAKKARLWQTDAKVTKRRKGGEGTYEAENDSPWFRFPKRMLQMRARVCLRDTYPDVLKGIQIREEVEDYARQEPRDITPAPNSEPAFSARLRAAKAKQAAEILPPIHDHVVAEIEAMEAQNFASDGPGYGDTEDGPSDQNGAAQGDTARQRAPEEEVATLNDFSQALMRASSKVGLKTYAADFWARHGGAPDESMAMHGWASRVYRQHLARVEGSVNSDKCRDAVEQILMEI